MKRICCYCTLEYGEKCGRCGGLEVRIWIRITWADITLWACQECSHFWIEGQDGKTDGICPECYEKETAKLGHATTGAVAGQ